MKAARRRKRASDQEVARAQPRYVYIYPRLTFITVRCCRFFYPPRRNSPSRRSIVDRGSRAFSRTERGQERPVQLRAHARVSPVKESPIFTVRHSNGQRETQTRKTSISWVIGVLILSDFNWFAIVALHGRSSIRNRRRAAARSTTGSRKRR